MVFGMNKKLKFSKETLKTLTPKELDKVIGGAVPTKPSIAPLVSDSFGCALE